MKDFLFLIFCSNTKCDYESCSRDPRGIPTDGTEVIFKDLEGTEYCDKEKEKK